MVLKFLKKLFFPEEEKLPEKVKLSELENWLDKEKKELENTKKKILETVKSQLSQLVSELDSEIKVLETLDLNNKKVEDKIKFIVKENLFLCIKHLKKLIENLKSINQDSKIENINLLFDDFSKRTRIPYEKATFLIGKELGAVKESISNFFRDSKTILEDNKEYIENLRIVKEIEKKFGELSKIEKQAAEVKNQLEQISLRNADKNNAIKILESEILRIKKSAEHLASEKEKEENDRKKFELNKEIASIRQNIDFKHLASIFHVSEKKMAQVKDYSENFLSALERDTGENLVLLLQEAKINQNIAEKIKKIIEKKRETESFKEKNLLEKPETEIKKIKSELDSLEKERTRIEKAGKNLEEQRSLILEDIKRNISIFSITLDL